MPGGLLEVESLVTSQLRLNAMPLFRASLMWLWWQGSYVCYFLIMCPHVIRYMISSRQSACHPGKTYRQQPMQSTEGFSSDWPSRQLIGNGTEQEHCLLCLRQTGFSYALTYQQKDKSLDTTLPMIKMQVSCLRPTQPPRGTQAIGGPKIA